MAKTTAKSALPYLRRLLEDEYVQEQLREAVIGLRTVYGRAARKRTQAADDKKLYASLRRAVTSIRNAVRELRETEPPPKRRGRKLLIVAVAAGGAAMLTRLGRQDRPSGPVDVYSTAVVATSDAADRKTVKTVA
jgi:hypothetical protein